MKNVIIAMFARLALIGAIISFLLVIQHYKAEAQTQPRPTAEKVIKDTVIKAQTFKLYQGSRGGRYIYVTSKKTGKVYKRYFKR